jgi:hypothetical protein
MNEERYTCAQTIEEARESFRTRDDFASAEACIAEADILPGDAIYRLAIPEGAPHRSGSDKFAHDDWWFYYAENWAEITEFVGFRKPSASEQQARIAFAQEVA